MKYRIILCLGLIFSLLAVQTIGIGAPATIPIYDDSFDNGNGAFYANGTPIIIAESGDNTVITWNGGSQIVPPTVRVFGGGGASTNFETSNITMNSGSVKLIYGGGISLDTATTAIVEKSTVVINGGTVTATVYGGGLLFSDLQESNVVINNGTLNAAVAGGAASSVISGVAYNSGTADAPKQSGTRVEKANITFHGGTLQTLWGGGQGYSYTGYSNVSVTGGKIESVLTSGGSNGYTGYVNTTVNGGTIEAIQSVNRGIVESAKTVLRSGRVNNLYVGGINTPDTTGIIKASDVLIIGGETNNLFSGISDSQPIDVTQSEYNAVFSPGTVINNQIQSGSAEVAFSVNLAQNDMVLQKGEEILLDFKVTTIPSGYEKYFENQSVKWFSDSETVVSVSETGRLTAIDSGEANVSVHLNEQKDSVHIRVESGYEVTVLEWLIILLLLAMCFLVYRR